MAESLLGDSYRARSVAGERAGSRTRTRVIVVLAIAVALAAAMTARHESRAYHACLDANTQTTGWEQAMTNVVRPSNSDAISKACAADSRLPKLLLF